MIAGVLALLLGSVPADDGVVRFVSPVEAQTLHIEFRFHTQSEQGIEEIDLTILPYESQTNTFGFIDCLRGPNVGCDSEMNTLPACWIRANNGSWIEQLFCTNFTKFEQFNSYLGISEGDPVPDFVVWTCHGITPTQFADCRKFDFDADNDVDFQDFSIYQKQYAAPIRPDAHAVWIEINSASAEEMQILADGIPLWEPVVDYTIVTTTPGNAKVAMYADIQTTKPLVAGLKPLSLFNCTVPSSDGTHASCDLNQPDAWVQYGFWIQQFVDATKHHGIYQEGVPVFVLENESILYENTITGTNTMDPVIVRAGLENFPKDVMYYWYPAVSSYLPERRAREQALYEIVADVLPHVRFVDTNRARHLTVFEHFEIAGVKANEALIDRPLVNMIYVYPNQFYWEDDQVAGALEFIFKGTEMIFYPGQSGFVQQGGVLNQILPPR